MWLAWQLSGIAAVKPAKNKYKQPAGMVRGGTARCNTRRQGGAAANGNGWVAWLRIQGIKGAAEPQTRQAVIKWNGEARGSKGQVKATTPVIMAA